MTRKISRREFIRIAGIGAGAATVITGCGPSSRYVVREPYTRMPEYTYNGLSTYYASTCRECPAGCGIVVRTEQGRALKIEGNPNHPVNYGKTCSRGQTALQGLYNPDRIRQPLKQNGRGSQDYSQVAWEEAINAVQQALQGDRPDQVAFLLGMVPDHLYDLVFELCKSMGAPAPVRYSAHAIFDARRTLVQAMRKLFSADAYPYFDLGNADVTFSFGANFLETYLSPIAFSRGFAQMRRGHTARRGYLVQFEPRLSQTGATADEWIPVVPGGEGIAALAIGRLIAEMRGSGIPAAYVGVNVEEAAAACGVPAIDLQRLANVFASASNPLAIPGGSAMASGNGLESAQSVLALNALVGNLGKPGGLFFSPPVAVQADHPTAPSSMVELNDLVTRMRQGAVKTLFIHAINPVFELPSALGFADGLAKVPQVISFASFPDETSRQADYIFPDHTGLESWGYQKALIGPDREVISGFQPVVVPFYNTRATADILLAAVQAIGGSLATALPYQDEVEFIQNSLVDLVTRDGFFSAPEIKTFMAKYQQFGGWWAIQSHLETPSAAGILDQPLSTSTANFAGTGELFLLPFMSPILGDGGGANKPWLQETPDPTTTVMWNSWVEINPATADQLGLEDDDVVKISSPYGEIEAAVYRYPAIRPDTIAIPFGQGHTAYGRYAQGRGINPVNLFSLLINGADDLAYISTRVHLEKTGRQQRLSRLESRLGVYGE
ncbi:MAG: molybdopterin dinucleotide binding domain-containing protein [Acidobacteriaceae bacterium]